MEPIESLGSVINAPEHQQSLTLVANDRAPGRARSFTRQTLRAWGAEDLMDDAVLIVSELTTNAERHGRAPAENAEVRPGVGGEQADEITLTLAVQADVVGIEVEDNSPEPQPKDCLPLRDQWPRPVPGRRDGRRLDRLSQGGRQR